MTGVVIVDKPAGWTSHDVVGKLRRIYSTKRVGHGGTLDPMATGVLPVFIGRATRAADMASGADKQYIAKLRFGVTTDTQDITGTVISTGDHLPDREQVISVLPRFTGEIKQIPPMYSAIKKDGKKLYELARKGVEVEREERRITVKRLEILSEQDGEFELLVDCSKGTYVRTLCHDIGQALGCGAVMTSLRRTAAGAFGEKQAVPLEEIIREYESGGDVEKFVSPLHLLFAPRECYTADSRSEGKIRNGAPFDAGVPDGEYRVFAENGEFLALCRCENGAMTTIKSFFEVK